ncbi:tyrosine-type recombinase/integrase [Streptomyces sp. NPDC004009]
MLPAAVRGQLALFPVRRRLERADFHRFTARSWPEEDVLTQLARESAAARGLSPTWPGMVMRLVRLALALRDANGEVLVAEEVLDQVNLPLKEAAGEMLARAGLLQARTGPRPPVWPVRGCKDCGSFGITASRCAGCQCWRGDPTRYPLGRCPRCERDGLAVHRVESLCRGCLVYVREYGDTAGPHTQLTFAGVLAHQLATRAGVLGFTPHKQSGPATREVSRRRAGRTSPPVSDHLLDPGQPPLFAMEREWTALRGLSATELPALTERAAQLLAGFAPLTPVPDPRRPAPAGAGVLRVLLAWLGAEAPFSEEDVLGLSATFSPTATARALGYLRRQGLLRPAGPAQQGEDALREIHAGRRQRVSELGRERRNRRHEAAIAAKLTVLPGPVAAQVRVWVRVMRGQGRRRHRAADYARIRRNLSTVLPVLKAWASVGLDLRQITAEHIRTELNQRQGSQARAVHHVLRSVFAALKQEKVVFHNPTLGISLTTAVPVPTPLPSDRLRGLLDRLDGPRARLTVGLVAVHGVRPLEVTRLRLDDLDLHRRTLRIRRGKGHQHVVHLDVLTLHLFAAWLTERRRNWPTSDNPHLLITSHCAHHPAQPPMSYCALRAAFDQTGMLPKQLWSDRVLDEARHTADPVHLVRVFGIHPHTAVRYVHAAHPDKALPKIR